MEPATQTTIVRVPDNFDENSISAIITAVHECPLGQPICFDLWGTRWVTPTLMAFLHAYMYSLSSGGTKVMLRYNPGTDVTQYLQRMDFFTLCGVELQERFHRHPPADRFVPLQKIDADSSHGQKHEQLAKGFASTIGGADLSEDVRKLLEYCVGELLNNVRQHACAPGFACAQFYPSTNLVSMAIADVGIGILESLKGNPEYARLEQDDAALRLAVQPNVTGKPRSSMPYAGVHTSGNGLFFLSRIAAKSRGRLYLYSGTALLKQHENRSPTTIRVAGYQGAAVGLSIPRGNVADYDRLMEDIRKERFKRVAPPPIRFR